jgi:hypothetical protein
MKFTALAATMPVRRPSPPVCDSEKSLPQTGGPVLATRAEPPLMHNIKQRIAHSLQHYRKKTNKTI